MKWLQINHLSRLRSPYNKGLSRIIARCASYYGNYTSNPNLNFVNGKLCGPSDTSRLCDNINPATGETVGEFYLSGQPDVDTAIQNAKEAFESWSERTASERSSIIRRAGEIIQQNKDDMVKLEAIDSGKVITEAGFDVDAVIECCNYFSSLCYTLNGEHIPISEKAFAYTRREPLGVCAGIGAWNFPISNIAWKVLPALACGNTFVYKPSPPTPRTSTLFAEILYDAGLPAGCLNVIQGDSDVGVALCKHSDVAKVSFTGSIATGAKVMETCAPGIKPITLELGGKSPHIIFEDSDMDNAIQGALMANYITQGEVCSNGARVYVHESIFDEFMEKIEVAVRQLKVGDTMDPTAQIGALITKEHFEKVSGFVERAKQEGARVLYGGSKHDFGVGNANNNGYYMTPCLMDECTDEMEIIREEHFGPIMCVMKFKDEDEVIQRANNTPTGLAGAVFTRDISRAHRVIAKLKAGSCCINTSNMYPVQIPFGGMKMSGIGRENSAAVLQHYTQLKSVYVELGDVDTMF